MTLINKYNDLKTFKINVCKVKSFGSGGVVVFYASQGFYSHDGYGMKYSIGIGINVRVLLS